MQIASYLHESLLKAGVASRLNDLSSTVVLERPLDESFVQRWQLACDQDISHVVVMPNVTENKVRTRTLQTLDRRFTGFVCGV